MLSEQDYQRAHALQFKTLYAKGFLEQLIVSANHPYYYLSMLMLGMHQDIIASIEHQIHTKTHSHQLTPAHAHQLPQQHYCWLIMAKATHQKQYLQLKKLMKSAYGAEGLYPVINQWIEEQQMVPKPLQSPLKEIRQSYEHLLQKSQQEDYFKIAEVPCFLISTRWLEKLYSNEEVTIPMINNSHLIEMMPYISCDEAAMHFNYRINQDVKEGLHYKIIAFQPWKYLKSAFGGVDVKRFTTPEINCTVEVTYRQIHFLITEDRCIYLKNITILVSKFDTFNKVIDRIKKLLIAYHAVPFKSLKREWQVIKANQLTLQTICNEIQSEDFKKIVNNIEGNAASYEKLPLEMTIDESSIFEHKNIVILNIVDPRFKDENVFAKVQLKRYIEIFQKQKCSVCNSIYNLTPCKCKNVFYCSAKCLKDKEFQKKHEKDCSIKLKEERSIKQLLQYYDIKKNQRVRELDLQKIGRVGLENLGNTCYMNAALQCVLRIDIITKYFLKNEHLQDLNVTNNLGSEGHLACAYGEFVKNYYNTNRKSLSPSAILRIIAKNPQFRGNNHQDSQQFLNYFLDKLHEDLNKIKVKPYIAEIESNGRQDSVVSAQSWANYKKRNLSLIESSFAGQYRSQIRCPDCEKISITFDPFMSVTLPFPKEEKTQFLEGFYLTPEGEFQKIETHVPSRCMTSQVYKKIFHQKYMHSFYHVNRKIGAEWLLQKSVFQNIANKGLLFFYSSPSEKSKIMVDVEIYQDGKFGSNSGLEYFVRKLYLDSIQTEEKMEEEILRVIKRPVCRALKDFKEKQNVSFQEYLQFVRTNHLVKIIKYSKDVFYPITGQFELAFKVTIEIKNNQKLYAFYPPKFNTSGTSYKLKAEYSKKKIGDSITVNELIEGFKEPEQLTEDNMWYCNVCKVHKLAEKIMSIHKLPKYLILHLKRFNHRGGRYVIYGEKIKTAIQIAGVEEINGDKYELVAIVNHFGSLTYGHYTAFVKKEEWYYYDDESVKRGRVSGENAYLLFYKRVQINN